MWTLAIVILINRSGMMVLPFLTLYSTKDLGFSITQAGIVTGMYGAGSLAGSWLGGWLTDRIGFYPVLSRSLVLGGIGMASLLLFSKFLHPVSGYLHYQYHLGCIPATINGRCIDI